MSPKGKQLLLAQVAAVAVMVASVGFGVACSCSTPTFGSLLPILATLGLLGCLQAFGSARFGGLWRYFILLVNTVLMTACYACAVGLGDDLGNGQFAITCAFFVLLWFTAAFFGDAQEGPKSRDRFLMAVAAHNASCILCSAILFVSMLRSYRYGRYWTWESVALVCFAFALLAGAWLYASARTAHDDSFFSRVCVVPPAPASSRAPIAKPQFEGQFLLFALTAPSEVFDRIIEDLRPDTGCFHVTTEYEFAIPEWARLEGGRICIDVPLTLFGKVELTNSLRIECEGGLSVYRMTEREAREALGSALEFGLCSAGLSYAAACQVAGRIVDLAYRIEDGSGDYEAACKTHLKEMGLEGKPLELASSFLVTLRFVRPTILRIQGDPGDSEHVHLAVMRDVSLVPIRTDRRGVFGRVRARVVRLFTKRRMRYYFNLGNADCAKTYHLTFSGPEKTYLAHMRLECVGSPEEFFVANDMKATNRYDQRKSRLYVRGGHGFSRCALMAGYEDRSHRAVVALCATSLVCFLIMFAMAFQYVFNVHSGDVALRDMVLPITVLGFTGVLSVWEAMESHRAEEWLWLGASASVVLSFVAITHFVWLYLPGNVAITSIDVTLWTAYLTVEFMVMESSVMALFERIKQHGALMDKVPYTVVAPTCSTHAAVDLFAERVRSLFAHLDVRYPKSGGSLDYTDRGRWRRSARRAHDIRAYEPLRGRHWGDGWLVPLWPAATNPSKAPYLAYCLFARDAVDEARRLLDEE